MPELPAEAVVLWAEKRDRKYRKVYLNLLTGSASRNRPSAHSIVAMGAAALFEVADTVGPEAVAERPPAVSAEAQSASENTAPDDEGVRQVHLTIEMENHKVSSHNQPVSAARGTSKHSEPGGSTLQQHGSHLVPTEGGRSRVSFPQVLTAPTGNTALTDKPPSPAVRTAEAVQAVFAASSTAAATGSNGISRSSQAAPRRPRTPPLADAESVYGSDAASLAPWSVMPTLNRSSLRVNRPGREPALPPQVAAHVANRLSTAAQDRPPGLLEQRRANRQRRLTFNPFSAVTALPGHGHRDEAAAVNAALQQQQLLRPAQHTGGELNADDGIDVGSAGLPSPQVGGGGAPPPSARGFISPRQEASDAGDILFKEGIRIHTSGKLQRGEDRYAPPSKGTGGGAAADSPRTVAQNIVAKHAHTAAPGWATIVHAKTAPAEGPAPALAPLPAPRGLHPLSPPGGAPGDAWSWDAGSTVEDATSLWDGSASEAWTDAGDAAAAAAVVGGGGIGAAVRGPSTGGTTGRRLHGALVNVHALVEAASEGQVVWVETIDQADGRAAAVPFVKSGGTILQGDAVKRPAGTLGAPGGDGDTAQRMQLPASSAPRSGRISLVQWTGHSARRLASPEHKPVPAPRMLDRARVIEAVTHGELQPGTDSAALSSAASGCADSAAGSTLGDFAPSHEDGDSKFARLRVSTHNASSDDDSGDDYSLTSGVTGGSWMPPAPGPLYVIGRPLTTADLNSMYGGGSVDINVVSGSGPPTMPPTRGIASTYYHEEMPARDSSGSPSSRGAVSPTLTSMTPRTQGRFETWTRKAASPRANTEDILSAAAADYQEAASRRPSFAVQSLQAKRAARQSNPGARSGFGFDTLREHDERAVVQATEGLTPASRAVDGFVPGVQAGADEEMAGLDSPGWGKPPPPPPPASGRPDRR